MANKKINQLVSKTSILSTDLFGIGDATTGQLYKKTIAELQAAIGGAVISVNGLVGTVVLDTDDIQELVSPTNKWFTDARARGAISLTVTGSSGASTYNSGTGVLNVPTYTLAGLGGISPTFLSGGTGISYNSGTGVISYSGTVYTDSSIRSLLSAGTGISYNSSTGAISYSGTVYTDSSIRALLSLTTTGSSGASTYNSTTGVINVPNYTLAGLGGISLTSLSGGTGITYNSSTGEISYSGTVYTDASVRALLSAGTGISYNSTTGVITSTITQYTDALARASISITTTGTSGASTYNSTTGVINVPQYQGAITLTTTGTSGAATFSSNTLNIPQYQAVLTNPVTGTGTSGHVTYWNGSGTIAGSANHFWDNTNARLGIGTSSPSGRLHIVGNTYDSSRIYLQRTTTDATGTYSMGVQGGSNNFGIVDEAQGNLTRLFISSNGNVAINTVNAVDKLSVVGNGTFINSDANDIRFVINPTSSIIYLSSTYNTTGGYVPLGFKTQDAERGRITNGGNWLLGTTSDNGERLYVSGAIRATSTITANSDIRIKSNITKIENALEKVGQISGYTYNTSYDDKRHGGVIAQEIDKVFPEIVNTGNDGLMGVEYGNISALLIEAIKEQNIKIKNLETLLASK
jgi:hypothetical protein